MNTRLLLVLDIVINALNMYLSSVAKIDFIHALLKKSVKRLVFFVVLLLTLLVSLWMSVLGVVFFCCVSLLNLTHVQAMLAVLGLNLIGILILLIWFRCIKKQIKSLRRSSSKIGLAYLIRIFNGLWNKSN